jgi:hypothetical protein
VRPGLALAVLILNVIALVSILGARQSTGRRLAWSAVVVLLPLAGAAGWLAARRHATSGRRNTGIVGA